MSLTTPGLWLWTARPQHCSPTRTRLIPSTYSFGSPITTAGSSAVPSSFTRKSEHAFDFAASPASFTSSQTCDERSSIRISEQQCTSTTWDAFQVPTFTISTPETHFHPPFCSKKHTLSPLQPPTQPRKSLKTNNRSLPPHPQPLPNHPQTPQTPTRILPRIPLHPSVYSVSPW